MLPKVHLCELDKESSSSKIEFRLLEQNLPQLYFGWSGESGNLGGSLLKGVASW